MYISSFWVVCGWRFGVCALECDRNVAPPKNTLVIVFPPQVSREVPCYVPGVLVFFCEVL